MQVQQPTFALHGSEAVLSCGLDGQIFADEQHGLFVRDTRVLSTYRCTIGSGSWMQLGSVVTSHDAARWEFQNPALQDALGDVPEGTLLLSLQRDVQRGMTDRLSLANFHTRTVHLRFVLQLDADFADIFEVKDRSLPPRLHIARVPAPDGFCLRYERDGFQRGLRVRFETETPYTVVGALTVFDLALKHGDNWQCTVHFEPQIEQPPRSPATAGTVLADHRRPTLAADGLVQGPFIRGQTDLRSLRAITPDGMPFLAAGIPWFFTLFGRDSLVTSLMAGLDGDWPARASLEVLRATQAANFDDWRDAEPGKIVHEKRYGELARNGSIPHAAYYGAHDAPALYCLALWQAWRWSGDEALLRACLPAAEAALHWCETHGDRDGDGLLEYGTRSRKGYRNQSWKDAGEAIVHADGTLAPLPIATVELQGYWFAAQLAMAELFETSGRSEEAARLREQASLLRAAVEDQFWLDEEGTYALALDGQKRPVRSISSNPGHLLWCGLPTPERASRVAERLMRGDMFTGWGLRTLSSDHPTYNPNSYQNGSVWPHDSALAAGGFRRYDLAGPFDQIAKALFECACSFSSDRLPELFSGMPKEHGQPVPYRVASSPQAWAAAAPVLLVQLLLGLTPDAPNHRCFISPRLPSWLPELRVEHIRVGAGVVHLHVARQGNDTVVVRAEGDDVAIEVGRSPAPLWGAAMPSGMLSKSPAAGRTDTAFHA